MQYDEIDVREVDQNGEMVIQIDGYHRPRPESKYPEYRRVVILDLTEAQARKLRARLGELLGE